MPRRTSKSAPSMNGTAPHTSYTTYMYDAYEGCMRSGQNIIIYVKYGWSRYDVGRPQPSDIMSDHACVSPERIVVFSAFQDS